MPREKWEIDYDREQRRIAAIQRKKKQPQYSLKPKNDRW